MPCIVVVCSTLLCEGMKEVKYVDNMLCCNLHINLSCGNLKSLKFLIYLLFLNDDSVCVASYDT